MGHATFRLQWRFCHWQYPESAFKIAVFDRWVVVLSGQSMVQELRKRPADELSAPRAFEEVRACVHVCHTMPWSHTVLLYYLRLHDGGGG